MPTAACRLRPVEGLRRLAAAARAGAIAGGSIEGSVLRVERTEGAVPDGAACPGRRPLPADARGADHGHPPRGGRRHPVHRGLHAPANPGSPCRLRRVRPAHPGPVGPRRGPARALAGQGAQVDTTTAAGRLVFGIFAALAEFVAVEACGRGRVERALKGEPSVMMGLPSTPPPSGPSSVWR